MLMSIWFLTMLQIFSMFVRILKFTVIKTPALCLTAGSFQKTLKSKHLLSGFRCRNIWNKQDGWEQVFFNTYLICCSETNSSLSRYRQYFSASCPHRTRMNVRHNTAFVNVFLSSCILWEDEDICLMWKRFGSPEKQTYYEHADSTQRI